MKKNLLLLFAALLSTIGTWAQDEDMLSTPLTLEAIEAGTVSFDNHAACPVTYRVNDGTAQTIESETKGVIVLKADDKVAFFGDNYTNSGSNIDCSADCYIYGNIMSLVSSSNFATADKLEGSFYRLFGYNKHLKNHPTHKLMLPATKLAKSCYSFMFDNCTGLTEAPELPATELAGGCYWSMFEGCTGLTKTPELPATTLADGCYYDMFRGCSSLKKAPVLPATTLAERCYQGMFERCGELTEVPMLPATKLVDCCYNFMFSNCPNLNSVTCLATDISAAHSTSFFLTDGSTTGTFYKHPDMKNWPAGIKGIPAGWKVVDYDMTGINAKTSDTKKTPATTYDLRGMKSAAGKKELKIVGDKKIMTK